VAEQVSDRITGGPRPKHQQLRELLIGLVVPGEAIPSERDLMVTYGVSRATVRKAIDGLVADGLLQRTHGLGTFAVRPRLETRLHLASFSQDMRRRGLQPSTRLISVTLALPPADVTDWLGLAPNQKAWRIVRIRLADNMPIAHEDGWYPAHLLPELDQQDLAGGSLYAILGEKYGRTREWRLRWERRCPPRCWCSGGDPSPVASASSTWSPATAATATWFTWN